MDISATGWVNPTYHWLTLIIESEINQARDIAHTNVRLENGKSCHVIQKHAGLPTARDRQVVLDSVTHVRIANKNWTSAKKHGSAASNPRIIPVLLVSDHFPTYKPSTSGSFWH